MNNKLLERIDIKRGVYVGLGNAVLRIMQNETTDILELLVRESIQNSLDAALKDKDVIVEFKVKEFNSSKLIENIEGLNKIIIREKFPNEIQKQIIIRDSNTTGLTGNPNIIEDRNSNLFKLIYNVGQRQEKEGSGGSWGYGKTIFFRFGIGLVLFYSRIKNPDNNYEERLAVSLIEDQEKENTYAIRGDNNYTGINFWGDKTLFNGRYEPMPIIDKDRIYKILDLFSIEPYKNDETGTLISIPFIDEQTLIKDLNSKFKETFFKYSNLNEFFYDSIQRWYAPRLNNKKYMYGNKNNLIAYVDDIQIEYSKQQKFFKLVNAMYLYATNNDDDLLKLEFSKVKFIKNDIIVNSRQINGMNGSKVGDFVFAKIHYADLGMNSPRDPENPYTLTNNEYEGISTDNSNKPLIMMTRKPGMIVKYEINGRWVHRMMESSYDEFIVGLFVLNSDENVYFDTNDGVLTLEEYIRSSEKADHQDWDDKGYKLGKDSISPKIVAKIINNIRGKVNEQFKLKENLENKGDTIHLQNIFAESILPPEGFGKLPTSNKKVNVGGNFNSKGKIANIDIMYREAKYEPNIIKIPFKIQVYKSDFSYIKIILLIQTESGNLSISYFEKKLGRTAPINLKSVNFFDNSKKIIKNTIKTNSSIIIRNKKHEIFPNEIINGEIVVSNFDKNVVPIFKVDIKGEKKDEKL